MSAMIEIRDLTKRFGPASAVSQVSLQIPKGAVYGLLGPNGAGKTTTFKCLLGLARPTAGSILIDGAPLEPAIFERLAYIPERSALYGWLSAQDHLDFCRRAYRRFDGLRAKELSDTFSLDLRKKVKSLSKGQQTAVALVLAFAIRPEILILDEPASGLDPVNQRIVLNLIIDAAANGATVLFASHQITQVERAADHIAILKRGSLILEGEIDTLKSREKVIQAFFDRDTPQLDGLGQDRRVRRTEKAGRVLRVYVREDSAGVMREVEALQPKAVEVQDLNLEDIFLNAVADDGKSAVTYGSALSGGQ